MSGFSEVLKKDISFKRKPKAKTDDKAAEGRAPRPTTAETPSSETTPKNASPKRGRSLSLPKPKRTRSRRRRKRRRSAPKQRKTAAAALSGGRHKQVVGLSIGASQLSAAVIVNNGRPKLVKAAHHALPPDVVAGGEVRDSEALANEITAFFTEADLPRKNVRLGIGSSRTGVRVFERPAVDDPRQLANAIRFRAYETLPIPIEEAMLDYHVVEETGHARPRAARRRLPRSRRPLRGDVRRGEDRARSASTSRPSPCSAPSAASRWLPASGPKLPASRSRSATTAPLSPSPTVASASSRESSTGAVPASRPPSSELSRSTARRPSRSSGHSTSPARCPRSRLTSGRPGLPRQRAAKSTASPASSPPRSTSTRISPTLWASPRSRSPAAAPIFKGLAEQLEELIGISVRVADPFARVGSGERRRLQRPGRRPRRRNRTGNRGLMRAVNLLPRQQVERKRERPNAVILVASIGGAAVVLALVAGFLLANRSVDRQRQNLSSAHARARGDPRAPPLGRHAVVPLRPC